MGAMATILCFHANFLTHDVANAVNKASKT